MAIQYGADTSLGVVILDVADPRAPRVLSTVASEFWFGVHNIALYNDRAYLAHSANRGMTVLDLSDPANPFVSGFWINDQPGSASIISDVFIGDGMAILSDDFPFLGGLILLDLADPDRPVMLSSFSIREGVHNAVRYGDYVYANQELGGWNQPLHIIDISDPRNPQQAGTFPCAEDVRGRYRRSAQYVG